MMKKLKLEAIQFDFFLLVWYDDLVQDRGIQVKLEDTGNKGDQLVIHQKDRGVSVIFL